MKLNDVFEKYLKIKSSWSLPITIQSNTYLYNRHIRKVIGENDLSDLSLEFIAEKFCYWRSYTSKHTVFDIKRLLNAFFNFLIDEGELDRNPLRKIKARIDDSIVTIRTPSEIDTMLKKAHDNNLVYTILVVLINTGLRISELKGMQWQDIDFTSKTLSIKRTYYGGAIHDTKTKSSRRTIYVPCVVLDALKNHQKNIPDCPWVFPSRTKRPMTTSWIGRIMKDFYIECGLSHVTLHSYRHYHATTLLAAGVPLKDVEKRLGWSNAIILLTRYAHATQVGEEKIRSFLDG